MNSEQLVLAFCEDSVPCLLYFILTQNVMKMSGGVVRLNT